MQKEQDQNGEIVIVQAGTLAALLHCTEAMCDDNPVYTNAIAAAQSSLEGIGFDIEGFAKNLDTVDEPQLVKLETSDIGIAIRDALEDDYISKITEIGADVVKEQTNAGFITFVDVSDASNPVIHLENGQRFVVRIVALEG